MDTLHSTSCNKRAQTKIYYCCMSQIRTHGCLSKLIQDEEITWTGINLFYVILIYMNYCFRLIHMNTAVWEQLWHWFNESFNVVLGNCMYAFLQFIGHVCWSLLMDKFSTNHNTYTSNGEKVFSAVHEDTKKLFHLKPIIRTRWNSVSFFMLFPFSITAIEQILFWRPT